MEGNTSLGHSWRHWRDTKAVKASRVKTPERRKFWVKKPQIPMLHFLAEKPSRKQWVRGWADEQKLPVVLANWAKSEGCGPQRLGVPDNHSEYTAVMVRKNSRVKQKQVAIQTLKPCDQSAQFTAACLLAPNIYMCWNLKQVLSSISSSNSNHCYCIFYVMFSHQ